MDRAGYRPRPRSVLLLLAAPEPCALALMMAASSLHTPGLEHPKDTCPVRCEQRAGLKYSLQACLCQTSAWCGPQIKQVCGQHGGGIGP